MRRTTRTYKPTDSVPPTAAPGSRAIVPGSRAIARAAPPRGPRPAGRQLGYPVGAPPAERSAGQEGPFDLVGPTVLSWPDHAELARPAGTSRSAVREYATQVAS